MRKLESGSGSPLRVVDLLARGSLRNTTALYLTPTSAVIDEVAIVSELEAISRVPPNTVVVLSEQMGSGGWLVSAALRHAWERRASAVVIPDSTFSRAVVGLAERLGISLLVADDDPASVALELAAEIGSAKSVVDVALARFARTVARESTINGVLNVLSEELGGLRVSIEYEGVTLASIGSGGKDEAPLAVDVRGVEDDSRARLVARIPSAGNHDRHLVREILEVAVPSLQAAWLVAEFREDASSVPGTLVADLGRTDTASLRDFDERYHHLFAQLGWHADQPYVAVWIRHDAVAPRTAERTAIVRLLWKRVGTRRPLAQVHGGWLAIVAAEDEESVFRLESRIMERTGTAFAELNLVAGLSRSQSAGLTLSAIVQEARLAAESAYRMRVATVTSFGRLGIETASHLVDGEAIVLLAEMTMPQLVAAPDFDQILTALVAFLDHKGSVSAAAISLDLHRNTLQTRLNRARELGVPLDEPTQLLSVYLTLGVLSRSRQTRPDTGNHPPREKRKPMTVQIESFEDLYREAREKVGVRLFTVSVIADAGTSMARVYTNHPDVYPVGGKKTFAEDTSPVWLKQVIEDQRPFLGADREAVRGFFFDYATIESLGCGAIINVPIVSEGETIGSMNFLDVEGSYDEASVGAAVSIADRSASVLKQALLALDVDSGTASKGTTSNGR